MIVMSIIQNQVIQMFNLEEGKRKGGVAKHVFGCSSHNNLAAAIDKKRSEISKQKPRSNYPLDGEALDPKGSAVINFRQIKNSQNVQGNKPKEFFQSKLKRADQNRPAPLHNVLSSKKPTLNDALSDRSLSKKREEDRRRTAKPAKPSSASSNEDFECNEELELKERRTEKKVQAVGVGVGVGKGRREGGEEEIREFQLRVGELQRAGQAESLQFLELREGSYKVDPLYIEKRQKQLSWLMRAILMDWMMHISYEFRLKRDTLHLALTLVDNFFDCTHHLAKADFQLAGATALFIAAKLEEFEPLSSREFAKSTKERYTAEEIRGMEVRMARALRFRLNPPTLSMWGNRVMQQWDGFLETAAMQQHPFFLAHPPLYFKRVDNEAYRLYRTLMQLLDCAILDIQTVQYRPKLLVLSLLYLLLGRETNQFSKKRVLQEFPRSSTYFLEESAFNQMFGFFLRESFGVQMRELLPSVQYLASFFTLALSYDRPLLGDEEGVENMGLEEYCSFQTYNPSMILTVEKRFRGIYQ